MVTHKTGLKPTKIKDQVWELHSPLPRTAHIDDHLSALLEVLEPKAATIQEISNELDAGVNAAIYYYQDFTPGIHLPAKSIDLLGKMNLSIDFDLYFLGSAQ